MNDNTKIYYTFHNKSGDTMNFTFTIVEIESMKGGFTNYMQSILDEVGFGEIEKTYRLMRLK